MTQQTLFNDADPLLVGVPDDTLVQALRQRGYMFEDNLIFAGDVREVERLADLIAGGIVEDALECLRGLACEAPPPATTLFLRDLRARQSEV